MKANKALKRLSKIQSLISDVAERYAASDGHIGKLLQEATEAIARVNAAVKGQAAKASAMSDNNQPVDHPDATATPKPERGRVQPKPGTAKRKGAAKSTPSRLQGCGGLRESSP